MEVPVTFIYVNQRDDVPVPAEGTTLQQILTQLGYGSTRVHASVGGSPIEPDTVVRPGQTVQAGPASAKGG